MKFAYIVLIIWMTSGLFSCNNETQEVAPLEVEKYQPPEIVNPLRYKVLSDQVFDTPGKTQVSLSVLVTDTGLTPSNLSGLLDYLYQEAISRTGFQFHTHPTAIDIYIFNDEKKFKSKLGQWIAMAIKLNDDPEPTIRIDDMQLRVLQSPKQEKFGLTEKERMAIWDKIIDVEDKAQWEADQKYDMTIPGQSMDYYSKNVDYAGEKMDQYKSNLAKELKLKRNILDSISVEGLSKGWAFPPNKYEKY